MDPSLGGEAQVESTSSQAVGVDSMQQEATGRNEPVDVERGMSRQQIDALTVQRHQSEILSGYVQSWWMFGAGTLCIALPLSACILIWNAVAMMRQSNPMNGCAGLLIEWLIVFLALHVYYVFLHSKVVKCLCGQNEQEPSQRTPPRKMMILNCLAALVVAAWNISGFVFVAASPASCREESPQLHAAVSYFASISFLTILFVFVSGNGTERTAAYVIRNGMVSSTQQATPDTFERQKVVSAGSPELGDCTQCAICLEDFADNPEKEIRQTTCDGKHVFHGQCLKGWLRMAHSCPLCRQDLCAGRVIGKRSGTGVQRRGEVV